MAVIFKIEGLENLKAKLKQIPIDLAEEISYELETAAQNIEAAAKGKAPRDNGFLVNEISYKEINPFEYEVVSAAEYSAYVEWGTRGKVNVPPELKEYASQFIGGGSSSIRGAKEAIFEWCRSKGIEEGAWFAIFISIMVNGSEPHPFFFEGYLAEKPKLVERIKKILSSER